MDEWEKRAARSMPKAIRGKLDENVDLLPQMRGLADSELRQMSVTITNLVEHVALMADKPRQNAQRQGDEIHARIEGHAVAVANQSERARSTSLRAVR